MPGMLDGIRVLELGEGTSAPFCSRLLADYGADVIKLEHPGGDPARRSGPFVGDDPHMEKSIPFLYLNTNKRSVTLDPATGSGRSLLDRLLQTADVVVENISRPSSKSQPGFPGERHPFKRSLPANFFPDISESYDLLVVTSITPFGQTGPRRDLAATDIVNLAFSGLLYHSGDSDREPLRNALDQSLYVAGINGAVATAAALFQRWTTGRSSRVDVSVVECLASHLVQAVPYYNFMGAIKGRRPVRGSGFEELMPARDGYVIPSVQGSQPWSTVAELIGVPALGDERFATGAGRIEFGEELNVLLLEGLAQWDRKSLFRASGERRLVFGMAQDAEDLCQCPHLWERGFFTAVDHPVAGTADYPGLGPRPSSIPYQVRRAAPLLGQHNTEIYQEELGLTSGELAQLKAAGAV